MAVTETRNAPATTATTTEKGASLARGPALILGTILLAAGLYSLYKQHTFPPFSNFPDGHAPIGGKVFGVFGANGWTGMLTAAAGGLLLFGAAQHLVAKTMSLVVGVALGAAAVIALISGDVLGMAAANHLTELAWGIAAAILLVNTLVPRRRRRVAAAADDGIRDREAVRNRQAVRDGEAVRDREAVRDGATSGDGTTPAGEETRVMHERADTEPGNDGARTQVMHEGGDARVVHEHDEEPAQRP